MKNAGKVIAVVFAVTVLAYIGIPAAGAVFDNDSNTFTQTEGETVNVVGDVNSTLTNVTTSDATYELSDSNTTKTVTVSEGANETVALTDGDVTVTLDSADGTEATTTYEYSNTYTWTDSATNLVGAVVMFLFLGIGVVLVAPALKEL